MARKIAGTPLGEILIELRHQAESRLDTLGLPSAWPAFLSLLRITESNEIDRSARSLFFPRDEATRTARLLFETYQLENWLATNEAERAVTSALRMTELADRSGLNSRRAKQALRELHYTPRRLPVTRTDIRWWRKTGNAIRKNNPALSTIEVARRIDPVRYHTVRKYL